MQRGPRKARPDDRLLIEPGISSGLATNLRATHRDFFRRIAAQEIALDAIEDRRRDGDIAFIREAVADSADVVIDAEDFLDHHDCRLGRHDSRPIENRPKPSV